MEKPDKGSLLKHIAEQITKTGYPLEIEVSDLMEEDWLVFNNHAYVDEEQKTTREIDVFAEAISNVDQWEKGEPAFFVSSEAVVECKKSDTHVWVFFTRPDPYLSIGYGQVLDFLQVFSQGKRRFLDDDKVDLPRLHYDRFRKIAHTYSEVKIQGQSSGKSEIFEASNQIMKFISYEFGETSKEIAKDLSNRDIYFIFPLIVFDGRLFEAVVRKNKLRLNAAPHLLLEASGHAFGIRRPVNYLIDVVAKPFLKEYLSLLNQDISVLLKYFKSNERALAEKAEELVDLLGL